MSACRVAVGELLVGAQGDAAEGSEEDEDEEEVEEEIVETKKKKAGKQTPKAPARAMKTRASTSAKQSTGDRLVIKIPTSVTRKTPKAGGSVDDTPVKPSKRRKTQKRELDDEEEV
jgi:hypothetical protein